MMRITVEIWPGGDKEQARTIGELDIWNKSELASVSDYGYALDAEGLVVKGEVRRHVRSDGWVPLLERVLKSLRRPPQAITTSGNEKEKAKT